MYTITAYNIQQRIITYDLPVDDIFLSPFFVISKNFRFASIGEVRLIFVRTYQRNDKNNRADDIDFPSIFMLVKNRYYNFANLNFIDKA